MRILHLSSEYPPQAVFGLGRFLDELAAAQAALGLQVHVFTNSHGGIDSDSRRNGVFIKRVHFPPPPKAPAASAMLLHFNLQLVERVVETLLIENSPTFDIVNVHDWLVVPAGFHLARLLKVPMVVTLHDIVFNKVRHRRFNEEDAYVAGIENWACHTAESVIVLSQTVSNEVRTAYHPQREPVVIPGGVGIVPATTENLSEIAAWRSRLAPNDENLLLYAGRLDPEKGIDTLLAAVALLRKRDVSGWKLALAGSGNLQEHLQQFIDQKGLASSVALLGYVPYADLRFAYAAADVVIVPSEYEPFGLVSLEAQKMGTPVIAANTGGLAETLKITEGGVLFGPGNPEELAARITDLISSPDDRAAMGRRGQDSVSKHYNWSSIAKRTLTVYEACLKGQPPQNLIPPPWVNPNIRGSRAVVSSEPISNVAVFWSTEHIDELKPILECLIASHALRALNSIINVIPAVLTSAGATWKEPISDSRIRYVKGQGIENSIRNILQDSAVVIAQAKLAPNLLNAGLAAPQIAPTLWYGSDTAVPEIGLAVRSVAELYGVIQKIACDDKLRRSLAPQLFNPIPSVSWKCPPRPKPEVMHVLPQLVTGGAETMLLELIKGSRERFDHHVLCLGPLDGPLPNEFRDVGAAITSLESASAEDVLRFLQTRQPDLLHLHSMSYIPDWILIHRRLTDQRIIETEHVVNIGSGQFGPVDVVACVSEATRSAHKPFESMLQSIGQQFQVIYNGINENDFKCLSSKEEARRSLGLPLDRPIIGRVSALARNKLPQEALDVIPHVIKLIPNALFAIVGDGPQRQPAEAWVAERGLKNSVVFLGERRDVPQVLCAFDVFAYYTTKDALGNVILEAVAAGVPVVTTDVEGTKEALGDAPGLLVSLGDYDQFALAVRSCIDNAGAKQIPSFSLPSKFTRAAMVESYSDVYKRILSQDRKEAISAESKAQAIVTVLVPVFNARKDWFIEAMDSLKSQLFSAWKLLLVDDGSEGEFHSWLTNYVMSDPVLSQKTRIIQLETNRGVAAALNVGLNECNTELVARMDADDRMRPDRLSLQVAAMLQRTEIAVIGGWAQLIDENGRALNGRYSYPCGHRQIVKMLGSSCAFAHPTVMYRRAAVLKAGGYRNECRHFEDYDLWVRMAEAGHRFANLPIPLVEYRVHSNSVSRVHHEHQGHGAADCARRAKKSEECRRQQHRPRVIFTGVQNSYGIPSRGLSVEQFFFARALEHMTELDLLRLPADELIRAHGQRDAGELLVAKAGEWRADLVFTVLGNPELDFLPEHIRSLTKSGTLTLNWNCDDHWRLPHTAEWATNYTHMVTTDPMAMSRFRELGLEKKLILSQWACNPFDYFPGNQTKDIDVSFVGQPYGNRPAMIQALRDAGVSVVLHGAGWKDGKEIDFPNMIDTLRRSKIVLNFSRATQGTRRQIKARFFEIPASGTFMLTEPAEGMEQYLLPGRHFDTFDSENELVDKVRMWLSRADRDAFAYEASVVIRSIHTFHRRLHDVFETIGLYDRN